MKGQNMIYDSLANFPAYITIHPLFRTVLEFIDNENIASLEKGKVNLSGGIYAIVHEYETKDRKDTFIECHKTYIDIQIILAGMEQIGICNKNISLNIIKRNYCPVSTSCYCCRFSTFFAYFNTGFIYNI